MHTCSLLVAKPRYLLTRYWPNALYESSKIGVCNKCNCHKQNCFITSTDVHYFLQNSTVAYIIISKYHSGSTPKKYNNSFPNLKIDALKWCIQLSEFKTCLEIYC